MVASQNLTLGKYIKLQWSVLQQGHRAGSCPTSPLPCWWSPDFWASMAVSLCLVGYVHNFVPKILGTCHGVTLGVCPLPSSLIILFLQAWGPHPPHLFALVQEHRKEEVWTEWCAQGTGGPFSHTRTSASLLSGYYWVTDPFNANWWLSSNIFLCTALTN